MVSKQKKVILGIIVIVSFLILAFNIFPFLGLSGHTNQCSIAEGCPHEKQIDFLQQALPIIVSLALVVGAGTYYLMSSKVEEKEVSLKKNTGTILRFLSDDERKLVNLLLENNGRILQAEVTRLPGMTKVKSHRVVQKLLDKGVIEKEKLGKTNIVKLPSEIKQGLL